MTVRMEGIIITPLSTSGSLSGLSDVILTAPIEDGQVLTFDGTALVWTNETLPPFPPTNLSLGTIAGDSVVINSSTGTSVTLQSANPVSAGVMSASEHSKLLTIQPGATANQTNAFLLNRANQTGTQVASTISDFAEAAQDATASLLVAGSNITLVYDDVANTLTISAAGGVTATNLAQGIRTIDTVEITSSTGTSATLTVATTTLAGVMSASDKAKLDNSVAGTQDIILDFLEAGTNVTLVHDTNTDKLIISSSGGSATVPLPESQIAFGDSNNEIASSSSLTFDSTVNSLSVGNSGPGAITSGSGETITITGDAGVAINATTGDVAINAGSGSSTITSGVGETITITGDAGVAINATTGDVTINVGSGDSVIEASTGNALSITGDTGMILKTNVNGVVFDLPFAALVTVNDLTSYNNALATNVSGDAFVTKSYADSIGGGAGSVSSVFSRTGAIIANGNDYAAFYATTAQGVLANSALQPNDVQVAAGQVAIGTGAPGVIGYSSLTYNNANSLTIGDNATDGLVINGTAGIMSITALPNNSDITLSPNGAGSVIIDNGSANGKIAANPGETLTVESGADMVISVPAGSVMKVADIAQYDAALAGNSGDALVTKSYADSILVTYTMDTVQEVTLPNSVNIALGGYLTHTATVANTWDFTVPFIPGKAISWTLELTNGGIDTQNFNSVMWAEGSPPTLKTSGLNILKFTKNNLTGITIGYLAV